MKIVCTLKEFELLLARCPMSTFLVDDENFKRLFGDCHEACLLSNFCKYGKDDDTGWSLADLVEIVTKEV